MRGNCKAGSFTGGSAVYILNASPTFENCRFESNRVWPDGGFEVWGGAVWMQGSDASFIDCLFENNETLQDGSSGGAVRADDLSAPLFMGCAFVNNRARSNYAARGGAIYLDGFRCRHRRLHLRV